MTFEESGSSLRHAHGDASRSGDTTDRLRWVTTSRVGEEVDLIATSVRQNDRRSIDVEMLGLLVERHNPLLDTTMPGYRVLSNYALAGVAAGVAERHVFAIPLCADRIFDVLVKGHAPELAVV